MTTVNRAQVESLVLTARTPDACMRAWQEVYAWLDQHPYDDFMLLATETLAMMTTALNLPIPPRSTSAQMEDVVPASLFLASWREFLHPRGHGGRFARKWKIKTPPAPSRPEMSLPEADGGWSRKTVGNAIHHTLSGSSYTIVALGGKEVHSYGTHGRARMTGGARRFYVHEGDPANSKYVFSTGKLAEAKAYVERRLPKESPGGPLRPRDDKIIDPINVKGSHRLKVSQALFDDLADAETKPDALDSATKSGRYQIVKISSPEDVKALRTTLDEVASYHQQQGGKNTAGILRAIRNIQNEMDRLVWPGQEDKAPPVETKSPETGNFIDDIRALEAQLAPWEIPYDGPPLETIKEGVVPDIGLTRFEALDWPKQHDPVDPLPPSDPRSLEMSMKQEAIPGDHYAQHIVNPDELQKWVDENHVDFSYIARDPRRPSPEMDKLIEKMPEGLRPPVAPGDGKWDWEISLKMDGQTVGRFMWVHRPRLQWHYKYEAKPPHHNPWGHLTRLDDSGRRVPTDLAIKQEDIVNEIGARVMDEVDKRMEAMDLPTQEEIGRATQAKIEARDLLANEEQILSRARHDWVVQEAIRRVTEDPRLRPGGDLYENSSWQYVYGDYFSRGKLREGVHVPHYTLSNHFPRTILRDIEQAATDAGMTLDTPHRQELRDVYNEAIKVEQALVDKKEHARREAIISVLSDIRPMGGEFQFLRKTRGRSGTAVLQEKLQEAAAIYPSAWIDRSNGKMMPGSDRTLPKIDPIFTDGRGFHYHDGRIKSSLSSTTPVHELGHRMEMVNPAIVMMERVFYRRRTELPDGSPEPLKKLKKLFPGSQYNADEITRQDEFLDSYMGKAYESVGNVEWGAATSFEVFTMGIQSLWANQSFDRFQRPGVRIPGLPKDPSGLGLPYEPPTGPPTVYDGDRDHARFILGLLAVA